MADSIAPASFRWELYKAFTDTLKLNTLKIESQSPTLIKASIKVDKPRVLYLSIPFDNGWSITDNSGWECKKYLLTNGMTGVLLQSGAHQLEMKYTSIYYNKGVWVGILGILAYISILFIYFRQLKRKTGEV